MRAAIPQGSDWARFRPGPIEGVTRMDAHFQDHAFERHSHATYSIGLTHSGVQTFHCGGELHASLPGDLILFNPDQAHDGQRGAPEGFGYSILYVTADAIAQCLDPAAGIELPRYFRRPVVRDAAIARRFSQALAALAQPGESLRAEELSRSVFTGILARHGEAGTRRSNALSAGEARMAQVRDYLHNHYAQDLTTQQLAAVAGLSRAHLTAAFTRHFGVPPHVYLNAVRVRQAQLVMLSGEPLAEVATACGFVDQSHLSRRFKGAVGTSPADWLRQMRAAS